MLVATDAAGEGVNLQSANLMVNYDLPWNPNRLEQRFGRIHRIGQTRGLPPLEPGRQGNPRGRRLPAPAREARSRARGPRRPVFDILGEVFDNTSLKDLLIEAIRYGDLPETRARLHQVIDGALDTARLKDIIERNALVDNAMSLDQLFAIKEEMDKAEARKLQPYFLRSFFLEAFQRVGGEVRRREGTRYEIRHVPALLRERDRLISDTRTPVLPRYERICFDKSEIHVDGRPMADLVHPAHPLMAALLDVTLGDHRAKLKQGAVLLDPADPGDQPSLLLLVDHSIREGTGANTHTISQRLQFVRADATGNMSFAGWAPHLDMQPLSAADLALIEPLLEQPWLASGLEARALTHAAAELAPGHFEEIHQRRERQLAKIHSAVRERLTKEINYLSRRAIELDLEVAAGRQPRVQPGQLRRRAEELAARLQSREKELESMRHVVSVTPVIVGGALIVPAGLLAKLRGETPAPFTIDAAARAEVERRAMAAVTAAEQAMGHTVKDVSAEKCGWDITAFPPAADGQLPQARHIEVKGRAKGQDSIIVTRNEICTALNQTDKFLLAIVLVDGDTVDGPHYVRNPFTQEPEPGVSAVTYELAGLLAKAWAG